jgi:hypothetical protein
VVASKAFTCLTCAGNSRSFLAHNATDILNPLGLSDEGGAKFPLSPKSERAYTRISHEFDVLFKALQTEADPTQSAPVCPNITHPPMAARARARTATVAELPQHEWEKFIVAAAVYTV